jgi:RluA family pseudouridine synthase
VASPANVSACLKLSSPATNEFWEIPVLYEDANLFALAKPSRLLTCPDRYDPLRPNLMKMLHRELERQAPWVRQRQISYLANAHRLDFETSGVLLLAKDKPSLVALANQFGVEKSGKIYVALVWGAPEETRFEVDAKLSPNPFKEGLVRVDLKHGKKAITQFEVRERFDGFTLLQCQPLTGRTHQVRVHLRSRNLRLVGDATYGGPPLWLSRLKPSYRLKPGHEERPLINRSALHAEQLTVFHPVTKEPVVITAPWPKDLAVAVKYLRKFAQATAGDPPLVNDAPADG